ncbi:MAG: toll/interleukin-1 receptor domain-containing protein, partial [Candidatus Heimdallarchaeota archaeon]|nr:toll/interleukin-1 receptor domain-containing protein [Candidatus Heimdallarchaeota archaeon]MCK4612103.1 toll/interleukin-1 receptor domain-containing protein [Candidatus Heimdallarchaeota archaeon]
MTLKTIDVFLSHSTKDKKLVSKFADDLTKSGVRPWLDEIELRKFGGMDLFQTIKKSVQKGKNPCMILFISSYSIRSQWVDREIEWLLGSDGKNFRLIPILVEKYEDLDLSVNMKNLLENIKGEKTTYYFEYKAENYDDLMSDIIFSIYNHFKLDEEDEIVFHAGHRLSWDRKKTPKIWEHHKILDFRTNIKNGNSYYTPTLKEVSEIEKGMDRTRKALVKLKRIYFCGATYLSFSGLLSKIWGRGSGVELICWNMMDSKVLSATFDVLTKE